ncbi:MAG TPA: transcription antitermination factor NusB, partial [Acidimicrobiales bacterium]|nr:transcription antitermination factor NusB [Acidimicrobiales bacterium]
MKPGTVTARGLAITALVAAENGERANLVVPALLSRSGLDERDRGFATELAYGALRMCRACDWLVGQFARGPLEPVVRAAARAGAYQLVFMRVPPYAAVSATVAEAPQRARPLLNAVLRRVAGLVQDGPPRWPDLGTRLSYPDWVIMRLGQDLGADRAMAALEQMNVAATPSVRPDGYVQDPGSQAVAEHMAGLLQGIPAPRGRGCV